MASTATVPATFSESLNSYTIAEKRAMIIALQDSIKHEQLKSKGGVVGDIVFSNYVEVVDQFLPPDYSDEEVIMAEVESLGLLKKSDKPQTQWLSLSGSTYYFSDNKKSPHTSKDLSHFPGISRLMGEVNKCTATTQDANAALVIVYNTDSAGIDFHDDAEALIDGNSSISTVTFGDSRRVQFCDHSLWPRLPQHEVNCGNHDMMTMKPGCQTKLVHRVCRGKGAGTGKPRIVISFRKECTAPPASQQEEARPTSAPPRSVTLIAGASYTAGLDPQKLSRRGRKEVRNLSNPGACIEDVLDQLKAFFLSDEYASGDVTVDKIILSVGTNDIRHCRKEGTRSLKVPLLYMVEQVKLLYPDAVVWLQSLIPLPWQHPHSVQNVQEFNSVIYEVCTHLNVFFLNVFADFLTFHPRYGLYYRNESLFLSGKNIHLNGRGMGRLARRYLNVIHSSFNPLAF